MKKFLATAALITCGAYGAAAQMLDTCKIAYQYRGRSNYKDAFYAGEDFGMLRFCGKDSLGRNDERSTLSLLIHDTNKSGKIGDQGDKIYIASYNPDPNNKHVHVSADLMETGNSMVYDDRNGYSPQAEILQMDLFRQNYTIPMVTREIAKKFDLILLNL